LFIKLKGNEEICRNNYAYNKLKRGLKMKNKLFKRIIGGILISILLFSTTVFANGTWSQTNSKWIYTDSTGALTKGWSSINGKWYFFNTDGTMFTGWLPTGSNWYYLNDNGDMAIGWKHIDGAWYYLNTNGNMAIGWKQVGTTWYYFYGDGSMAFNTTIGGYILDSNGAWTNTTSGVTSDKAEQLVRQYLINNNLYVPKYIQYTFDEGNSYVIHCYDIVVDHTATSGWYYVDKTTGSIKSEF
jgi:glucan-binding YG repeat protein